MASIRSAFDEFILDQKSKGNSPRTIEFYEMAFRQFNAYHSWEQDASTITIKVLKNYTLYLQEKDITDTSVQSYVRALRSFLNWGYKEEGIFKENLADKYKLPKAKKQIIDILTNDEIKLIFNQFNPNYIVHLRNICICSLMIDSGLRRSEIVNLKISDLHIADGYAIVNGKGNKQRNVPLGFSTRKYLLKYLRKRNFIHCDKLFLVGNGEPIKISTITQLFKKLKKSIGIKRLHPHLMRHTFATKYLINGGDVFSLQQILGHTTLDMVRRYVHLANSIQVSRFSDFSPLDNLLK